MQPLMAKFVLALAASPLDREELVEVLRLARSVPPRDLIPIIEAVRGLVTDGEEELGEREPRSRSATQSKSSGTEAAALIDQMLRDDARLSAAQAADLLAEEVRRRYGAGTSIPPYTRNSFIDWLDRLLKVVPSSELMHLAARLRNNIVHSPSDQAWHLKEPK